MDKKGLSNIIATVLIILLVLCAVAIIWVIIRHATTKTLMSARDESTLMGVRFNIIDSSVNVSTDQNISFIVEREPSGENTSVFPIPVLEDSWGYSKAINRYNTTNLKEFERILVNVTEAEHGLPGKLKRILVYPALINPDGEIVTSRAPSDAYEIQGVQMGDGGGEGQSYLVDLTLGTSPDGVGNVINENDVEYPYFSQYLNGTVLILRANVTDEDYIFFSWFKDGNLFSIAPSMLLTLDQSMNITANFALGTVNLTLHDNPAGIGNITNESGIEYPDFSRHWNGESLALIARVTNENYTFFNWLENGVEFDSVSNPLMLNITSDRNITANYTKFDFLGATPLLPDLISWISDVNTNCGYVNEDCLCNVEFNLVTKNIGMGWAGPSATRVSLVGGYDVTTMVTTPPLKRNQNVTTFLVVPGSFPAGNYNLSSYADWYQTIREQNENNNNFTTPLDAHC